MLACIAAFATLTLAALAVGGVVGRTWGMTKKQRASNLALEQAAEQTVQQLTYAVAGKPKDQWGEREPGLIEQMAKLNADFRAHVADDIRMMGESHARLSATETSASSAALALAQTAKETAEALAKQVDVRDNTADVLASLANRLDAIEHSKAS
jgi:uncharacterized membrane protein